MVFSVSHSDSALINSAAVKTWRRWRKRQIKPSRWLLGGVGDRENTRQLRKNRARFALPAALPAAT
jgi:hypothetical protein